MGWRVSPIRSKVMAAIKGRDTKPEMAMRRHLSALGLRYRLCRPGLPGRPDIVFASAKVVVFCDGDFWHGRRWAARKARGEFKVRRGYWLPKIERNIARDKANNRKLKKMGWLVIRVWESDILRDGKRIAKDVRKEVLRGSRRKPQTSGASRVLRLRARSSRKPSRRTRGVRVPTIQG